VKQQDSGSLLQNQSSVLAAMKRIARIERDASWPKRSCELETEGERSKILAGRYFNSTLETIVDIECNLMMCTVACDRDPRDDIIT
jgi:hypothetical protein